MLILTPTPSSAHEPPDHATSVDWVRSVDGQRVDGHGQNPVALLPADPEVVLVVPLRTLSWHQVAVPKAAASRWRAVLNGLLEERVLGDTADLHFALEPGARSGQTLWIAACDKAWLRSWLQALEGAGRPVTRIVPALCPPANGQARVHWAYGSADAPWLATADADGVRCLPLLAASMLVSAETADSATGTRWLADPAVAAAAEQALDQRFEPLPLSAGLLRSAQTDWNLAQFDLSLSATARRRQQWRQSLRHLRSAPAWRPARWGLVMLLLVQVLGLNIAAWQERDDLADKRLAVRQTLQQTFPQVTLVLDAPQQMQRELAQLQRASGQLSARDLEAMLTAVGRGDAAPARQLRYQTGELQLDTADATRLAQMLSGSGWLARADGNRLILRPAP